MKEIKLFHTPNFEPFATVDINGHLETWPLRSRTLKLALRRLHYEENEEALKRNTLEEKIDELEAKALFDGKTFEVFIRVARTKNAIYVDLGNENWEAVKITKKGWEVVKKYPVKFYRAPGMASLPYPKAGGSIKKLKKYLNCSDDSDLILMTSWLLGALSFGPFTILVFNGPHGSAKSTNAKILRTIIDPSNLDLISLPKNERDLAIAANNSCVLAFDNVSFIQNELSNAFCRLATGGGFRIRKLYSDSDENIITVKRPFIINGIDVLAHQHDLISRCILLTLPRINPQKRRPEDQFLSEFNKDLPSILGGLYDAVSAALRNYNSIKIKNLPRMADFAKWVSAAEEELPWEKGKFLTYYRSNIEQASITSISADVVAESVIALMREMSKWNGTATDLLDTLESGSEVGTGFVPKNIIRNRKIWPQTPHSLSRRLRMASSNLEDTGIKIDFGKRTAKKRLITIKRVTKKKKRK